MSRSRSRYHAEPKYGYWGSVTLVSPTGETIKVSVPGREIVQYRKANGFSEDRDDLVVGRAICTKEGREAVLRKSRRFQNLLARGWRVAGYVYLAGQELPAPVVTPANAVMPKEPEVRPEQKESEDVDEVAEATSMTSEDVHGGNEATKDIVDSSNAADDGQNPENHGAEAGVDGDEGSGDGQGDQSPSEHDSLSEGSADRPSRGSRGGRSERRKAERAQVRRLAAQTQPPQVAKPTRNGTTAVLCLRPLDISPGMRRAAHKSAELLAKLIGRSTQKTVQGTQVQAMDLLLALETGDNPLPALERPRERPRLKVLITPDSSGSCQDWSGLGRAWALEVAKLPNVDVIYVGNMNGQFTDAEYRLVADEAVDGMLREVDVVIYLGDGDGYELCHDYASRGATVVALDSYCASVAKPRLREVNRRGSGVVYWVDKVSNCDASTWYVALKLVMERQFV